MASEGPNSPGTMAEDEEVGNVGWNFGSGIDAAKVSDDSRTDAQLGRDF